MKNIKVFLIIILMNVVLVSVIAQGVDPALVNPLTAQPALEEISVDKFEDSALWEAHISLDDGVATSRGFDGGPGEVNGKQLIDQEADERVLGVRVDYFRRGNTIISVDRVRPLEIEGISKTISVWVAGRNYNHDLFVHLEGYTGKQYKLPMGKLNFSGWKQLTVAIPPTVDQVNPFYAPPPRDENGNTIAPLNPRYINRQGVAFIGFSIEPALLETYGSYYVYFDDLRVWTDLFSRQAENPNDLSDGW